MSSPDMRLSGVSWEWADPAVLWVGGAMLLAWAAAWWWLQRPGRRGAVTYSSTAPAERLPRSWAQRLRPWVQALRLVTVALVLLALARPRTGERLTTVSTEGVAIVLALDTSGSMRALDLDTDLPLQRRRNRLQVARDVVTRFIDARGTDSLGLVVFGTEAFTQCPLTLDHNILTQLLDRVEVGMAGEDTAVGSALGTAVKRVRESEAESRVIILLTDGRSNAGVLDPLRAAEVAAAFDIKVYTIGVGARGKAPFLVSTPIGLQQQLVDVEIDEETLREIAAITGGEYFRAEEADSLEAIYARIDELEKTEITTESYVEYEERFHWLVIPALGLLIAEVGLLRTRLRTLP